jgi:hypothetical protein
MKTVERIRGGTAKEIDKGRKALEQESPAKRRTNR